MAFLLLVLIVLPLVAFRRAREHAHAHKFAILGIFWGLVASPFSLGLYSLGSAIPVVGIPVGAAGLWSLFVHAAPGQAIASSFGLIDPGAAANARTFVIASLFDGLVWVMTYGVIGFVIDRAMNRIS